MNNDLDLIGRNLPLFDDDIKNFEDSLIRLVNNNSFLVIGGAGSIGKSVVYEIFKRNPKCLHIVDVSENNLVELVRDIRSSLGYIDGDFRTFAIDCGSNEFTALMNSGVKYDYVLNLSALKHVRSERDPFTLMRLVEVNILNTISTMQLAINNGAKKYFCVSTDKAANPVNMMGASKRIMEMFLMRASDEISISTARFANVVFSDGSLPHGFKQRIMKNQPISAPYDVKRYFITHQESGELCLMSCLLGETRDIFFPKLDESLHLTTFANIAIRFLENLGYEAFECTSENEARMRSKELISQNKWPCYFFKSDTTGEKDFEEFFTVNETLNMSIFKMIGVIKNNRIYDSSKLDFFMDAILKIKSKSSWEKREIVELFSYMIPEFNHNETNKYLDQRM